MIIIVMIKNQIIKKLNIQHIETYFFIIRMSNSTINYTDFNPTYLTFTKLEENDRSNGQLIGYPKYNKNGMEIPLYIQLPWIKLFTYGVPSLGPYYKTDNDRAHIKIPLDVNDPEVLIFIEKLQEIDKIMTTPEMLESILGKKAKKYKYSPLYRKVIITEENSDDEEDNKTKKIDKPRPPYFKLKLKLSYPDKKVESKVFESEESEDTKKRIRTFVETSTIDEFTSYIRWNSRVRPVIKPFKIWAHPLTKKDPEFGISCRLERIEVDKASISGIYKSVYDNDNFIDSDDEEIPKISNLKIKEVNDSEDDSSDDEIEEKITKIVQIDTDSDSDEIKNIKEDSDEEIVITKPKSKNNKTRKSIKNT